MKQNTARRPGESFTFDKRLERFGPRWALDSIAGPAPHPAEVELRTQLATVDRQHDSSWRMQGAASNARDVILKMHGGGLVALPIVLGVTGGSGHYLSPRTAILVLLAGATFLTFSSLNAVRSTTLFRMLQFRQDRNKHIAEGKLHDLGASTSLWTGSDWIRPLNRLVGRRRRLPRESEDERNVNKPQWDPMGLPCSTIADLFVVDCVAVAAVAAYVTNAMLGFIRWGQINVWTTTLLGVVGVAAGAASLTWVVFYIAAQEEETRDKTQS
jgi:hypothetical protein